MVVPARQAGIVSDSIASARALLGLHQVHHLERVDDEHRDHREDDDTRTGST